MDNLRSFVTRCEPRRSSARELTKDFFRPHREPQTVELNAFLALSVDRAYAQADRIDAMIAKGRRAACAGRCSHRREGRNQHPRRHHKPAAPKILEDLRFQAL